MGLGVLKNVAPIVEGKRFKVLTIVAPIILLSLILPTWDVCSDGLLIFEFFYGDFATCLRRTIDTCPLENCTIWYGCTWGGSYSTENCGYCKIDNNHKVCDFHRNFGIMLLGTGFRCLIVEYYL